MRPATITLGEARKRLEGIADDLAAIRARLLDLQASLPESAAERGSGDLEVMEEAAEMRAVIGCVVTDSIRPAIDDLRDVAALAQGPANA